MPLERTKQFPLMCLTQDGLPFSHEEQARRLCAAGAKWIQLRMKNAAPDAWRQTAAAVVKICRAHHAICIVNDSVDVALAVGADGVHLGRDDEKWQEARERLWPDRILGGTINSEADALRAIEADCLDYVGVGPWRFTSNKKNLAPLLGAEGVRAIVQLLDGLPAWAIGGIEAEDLPAVRATGAAGAAVSSALFRGPSVAENFSTLLAAWQSPQLHS
ncbi:MAG TPA: thiamine phosphate synthase [Opitutaceae bacterium]|nr:thiamine phosphate synthase [Opitutaceae bacterium]